MMPRFPDSETQSAGVAPSRIVKDEHARRERVQTKNRRTRYLQLHPEYFEEPSLELADPLLYDRIVRRFQSAQEREEEGRAKGYSGILEANLLRSEAKLEALRSSDPNSPMVYARAPDGSITGVEQDVEDRPRGKAAGWEQWKNVMSSRFVRGDDEDFDYATVDGNEDFDDRNEEERTKLDEYLEGEEARFVGEGTPTGETGVQDY